jgi:hypothetical protein
MPKLIFRSKVSPHLMSQNPIHGGYSKPYRLPRSQSADY